jgi:hypothetical protein
MSTPPAPPAPPTPPAPPAPQGDPPKPPAADPPKPADDLAELRRSLDAERTARQKAETALTKLQQQGMTDAEKAIAEARAEGKAEAAADHARALAAAEFRAQAAGKIAEPDAALELLDLAKLVKDGKPDKDAISAAVTRLAAVPPAPGHVPSGPRQPAGNGGTDWLGQTIRAGGR